MRAARSKRTNRIHLYFDSVTVRDRIFLTLKALQILAQGKPNDAVAKAPPWVYGPSEQAVESWIRPSIGVLPRPHQAASCFGLGNRTIPCSPLSSAAAANGTFTQGGVILA